MLTSQNEKCRLLQHWAYSIRAIVAVGATVAVANPFIREIIPAARGGDVRARAVGRRREIAGTVEFPPRQYVDRSSSICVRRALCPPGGYAGERERAVAAGPRLSFRNGIGT